jgi:hypothetical protein
MIQNRQVHDRKLALRLLILIPDCSCVNVPEQHRPGRSRSLLGPRKTQLSRRSVKWDFD